MRTAEMNINVTAESRFVRRFMNRPSIQEIVWAASVYEAEKFSVDMYVLGWGELQDELILLVEENKEYFEMASYLYWGYLSDKAELLGIEEVLFGPEYEDLCPYQMPVEVD